ncbi:MAG: type IX secretion system sortase PorU [Bacteroidales bacterium]|nr:type IX secretion system sortase PorU [Bacteroidales bacterium]
MSRYKTLYLISILVLSLVMGTWAQTSGAGSIPPITIQETLQWKPVKIVEVAPGEWVTLLTFDGSAMTDATGKLPVFFHRSPLPAIQGVIDRVHFNSVVYQPLTPPEILTIGDVMSIPVTIEPIAGIVKQRKAPFAEISFLPFRRNPESGMIEKVVSFKLTCYFAEANPAAASFSQAGYAEHSVLATGSWYKFSASANGIYLLSYDDLLNAEINLSGIDPRTIKIYGNGGGMLPEANNAPRIDDLRELSIQVIGEEDGQFNQGDYILFYGESQNIWYYSSLEGLFRHRKNIYADNTYYFLTFGGGNGKRVIHESGTSTPPTHTITRFNDYAFYEKDDINLIQSGREWFDVEYFDVTASRNYSFAFPDLDQSAPAFITARVAARSTTGNSGFNVAVNGQSLLNISIPKVSGDFLDTFAREKMETGSIVVTKPTIDVQLTYNKPSTAAVGYLNYLEINVMRQLKLSGSQVLFRSIESAGRDRISEFRLTTQGQQVQVWDVTRPDSVLLIQTNITGTVCSFRLPTDTLREFVAFDGSGFLRPDFAGRVENQDLHGAVVYDYIMVAYPAFVPEANRLAQFHQEKNGMSVLITTPQTIFNEFSSGAQDLSAIRDFMRMLYERAPSGEEPKYLLLFGDASYDYKNRKENNTNFVLAYQSPESLVPVGSYVTDDYFALLDDTEGQGTGGSLDLGVGRLPVMSLQEATEAVDKILHYCSESDSVKNDWRNVVCFIADDGDGNLHLNQVEELTDMVSVQHPVYNIDKIYLDAYQQISTPGGQRCPEVNDAINKRVDKGALIINYTGHGGELGWAHERVLEVPDIKAWTNFGNMPVFITATCEFSRYDDPERVSAGEWVFLNPNGGGIALFTTTRPTFAGSNFALATNFYNVAFDKVNGEYLRMGDLILTSKNNTSSSANTRKFVLLGDPALKMAYPNLNVVTTAITSDTLMALSEVTISGEVQNENGTLASGFNGLVLPTVLDKPSEIMTLGNDGDPPIEFLVQKNQIYKGKVQVVDGQFSFSFIIPKDIAYKFGTGKISYYARSAETDANGFDTSVVVGGFNPLAIKDEQGPDITLYMNTIGFVSGGITNQNPVLLAYVTDESGINTVGNGIGHDITAILDEDSKNPQILNDYYVADLNTYQSGWISYPYYNLPEGRHSITLKVWDVFNNSSEAVISFVVYGTGEFVMDHLYNYPNPFQDKTTISFETNQTNMNVEIEIQIYTIFGKLLKTIRTTQFIHGYRVQPVTWDGTADGGWKVSTGTYIYRAILRLPDGSVNSATAKLVVIR